MYIQHPASEYQGIAAEDSYFVFSDQHIQLGYGYIIHFYQNELYPEQPHHFYLSMDAQPSARSLLYGALYARSTQMKTQLNAPTGRLYTQTDPKETELFRFYQKMGLRDDDAEDMYSFVLPYGRAAAPMGFEYWQSPLSTPQDESALLERINRYRIQPVSRDYLTLWRQQEHFLALAFYRQGIPVCECVITGTGTSATLLSIFTLPQFRNKRLAVQLIEAASVHLRNQGVQMIYTHVFRRNRPQMGLIRHFAGTFVRTVNQLPGVEI